MSLRILEKYGDCVSNASTTEWSYENCSLYIVIGILCCVDDDVFFLSIILQLAALCHLGKATAE